MKRDTKRFAKRQLTWFRHDPDIAWIMLPDALRGGSNQNEKLLETGDKLTYYSIYAHIVRNNGFFLSLQRPDISADEAIHA